MSDLTPIAEVIESLYPKCKESILCPYPPIKNGYCFRHAVKESKQKKPVKKVSDKRKEQNKEYRKIVKAELAKNTQCQIKAPGCTGKAQGLNHKQKRTPKNLLELGNLERACNHCNLYVELHPEFAKANGHQISRFKK